MKKLIYLATIAAISLHTNSAIADANVTNINITRLETYTSYADVNYDIVVGLDAVCPTGGSFYLPVGSTPNNEGTKQVYSLLLGAFMADKSVSVNFQDGMSPNFTSSTNHCEIRKVWVPR